MKAFAAAAAMAFLSVPALAATVAPADAAKHVGEVTTVEGVVAAVHVAPNGMILLDLGGRSPDNQFTAVIFRDNAPSFGRVSLYVGSIVQISGSIQIYHGKPEITLTNEGQIQVITPAHNQKLST